MQIFNPDHILLTKTYMLYINHQSSENCTNINQQTSLIHNSSTFQSEKNISLIYDKTGHLKCKLITQYITHTNNTKTIYLTQPIAILFNKHRTPIWNIQAQKAKITRDKIMYLHGSVQITNLKKNSYLNISTHTAILNLITYDIFSIEKTTIYGKNFKTIAMNIQGNLKKKLQNYQKQYTHYMKYNIQKKFNKQLLKKQTFILLLMTTQNSLASITNNNNKTQIQIYSNYQNINMITNTLTITGNILLTINTINIYADKISVAYFTKNNKEKIINAYGNPIVFYQFKNNKNQILATSLHMSYTTYNDTIMLKNKVYLRKNKNILQSDCITYNIKNKYIKTCNRDHSSGKTKFTFTINKNYTNVYHSHLPFQSNQKYK